MAGRGRGRGRGASRPVTAEIGIEREEIPAPVLQPPPLFPELANQPLPFENDITELLRIKQNLRLAFNESHFFIKPAVIKSAIEKYSDSSCTQTKRCTLQEKLDLTKFPKELKSIKKKKMKKIVKLHVNKKINGDNVNVVEKLEELEKKENDNGDEDEDEDEKEKEDEESEMKEEEYDEEIEEDETDYVTSYFDNGEGYLDDEDDNLDDGPVY